MLDDDLERALDRAYGGDDHAKAAGRADLVAMHDHDTMDAAGPHELIARKLWGALRTLGISGGRMLALGQDAELFAGLPAAERCLRPGGHDDPPQDLTRIRSPAGGRTAGGRRPARGDHDGVAPPTFTSATGEMPYDCPGHSRQTEFKEPVFHARQHTTGRPSIQQ
jgi:hypothetical protein